MSWKSVSHTKNGGCRSMYVDKNSCNWGLASDRKRESALVWRVLCCGTAFLALSIRRQTSIAWIILISWYIRKSCPCIIVLLQDDANTAGPRQAFFQTAKKLDRFVTPAMPTPDQADKIKSINLTWAFEIRLTLVIHYRTQLDFLSGSLKAWKISATDCTQAKRKSKEWAKRKFKPQTLSDFDHRIQQMFAVPKPIQTPQSDRPQRILGEAIPVDIVDVQPIPTDQPNTNVNRSPSPTPGMSGYSQAAKSPPSKNPSIPPQNLAASPNHQLSGSVQTKTFCSSLESPLGNSQSHERHFDDRNLKLFPNPSGLSWLRPNCVLSRPQTSVFTPPSQIFQILPWLLRPRQETPKRSHQLWP